MKKIVFTGGGTYGHAMPNVYLIEGLKEQASNKLTTNQQFEFFYIGSQAIEKHLVKRYVNEYITIPTVKLVRGKIWTNFKIPFVLIKAIFKAKKALKQIKPDVVFSKGGYVALPVCIAAKMLKIPVIAHESDYSFGLANKIILKTCQTMCVNFEHLTQKSKKIVYTGPIFSTDFENEKNKLTKGSLINRVPVTLNPSLPTMLVVGGSLGAVRINEMVCSIAKDLTTKFNVIHLTGKGNKKMRSFGNYNAFEMADDMNTIYNSVDFVLGRSGAGVTAECYFKKLPMILIPLENKASRGDQVQNAQYYVEHGVAKLLHETDMDANLLLIEINNFYKNISSYKQAYKKQQATNGRQKIIEIINNSTK